MKQQQALDLLKLGENVFLTGAPGAGKTFLLNRYIRYLRSYGVKVVVTASTGIAATHLGGQTIHSWSGIGIRDSLSEEGLEKICSDKRIKRNFKHAKVLIIDEISMLHARQLDMIDAVARGLLNKAAPFGGLQMVVSGDFFQLPPVVRGDDLLSFAFESAAWQEGQFQVCYLDEQHRQQNDPLLVVLNDIRTGNVGDHTKVPLRTRYKKEPIVASGIILRPTKLYARNINVDSINNRELESLSGEVHTFQMTSSGFSKQVEGLKKSCLAPEELNLKVGAQVLFVKNSPEGLYVNGTRGVVKDFEQGQGWPVIMTLDGREIVATPQEWQLLEEDVVRATISQVPLRLAWAITIHKSQGITLDAAEIDLSDAFEPGMGYVALSRVRTLAGLKLMGLNEISLQVNEEVLKRDIEMQESSRSVRSELKELAEEDKLRMQSDVLLGRFKGWLEHPLPAISTVKQKKKKVLASEIIATMVEQKMSLQEIATARNIKPETVLGYLERLKSKKSLPCIKHLLAEVSEKDFNLIMTEMVQSEDGKLKPIFEKFGGTFDYDILKLVRLSMN